MKGSGVTYLYSITKLDGFRRYIGITTNPAERWAMHRWLVGKSQYPLYRAIAKYGADAFRFEVIACARNWEDGVQVERQLIEQFGSHISHGGYNLTKGGDGKYGFECSPATRAKISQSNKGRKGRPIPEQERILQSERMLKMYLERPELRAELGRRTTDSRIKNGNLFGRINSTTIREKMRKAALERWSQHESSERSLIVRGSYTVEERKARAIRGAKTRMDSGDGIAGLLRMTKEERSAARKRAWITRKANSSITK